MAAGKYNFTIEQGATLDFEIRYKDGTGTAVDLSGYTGKMQIRSNYSGSGSTYLTLTSSLGDTYTKSSSSLFLSFSGSDLNNPPTSGSIGVYIGWYHTNTLNYISPAYYDLEITAADSTKTRIIEGKINLSRQVTD